MINIAALAPMRKRYQAVPEEDLEPDIIRELTTPLLEIDDNDFEPFIKPEDVQDYSAGNRRILETMSVMSQMIDFLLYATLLQNRQLRAREAAQIRAKRQWDRREREEGQTKWILGGVKWAGTILVTAALVYFFGLLTGKK